MSAQGGGGGAEGGGGASRPLQSSPAPPGAPPPSEVPSMPRAHSAGDTRVKSLLKGLTLTGDDSAVLASLSQLCDLITYSSDEGLLLAGLSGGSSSCIPNLVRLLDSPDGSILLMTTKILTQCFDQVPGTISVAVQEGVVQGLCEKLLCIEYIDVAEQSICALDKIAAAYSRPILSCDGVNAILCFLDFYSISIQRVAVRTVANVCRNVSADRESKVLDAAPVLVNLLGHSDGKIVESASLAIVRALESFERSSGGKCLVVARKMEEMAAHGLVSQAMNLLATALPDNASAQLIEMTPGLTELLLQMLALLARYSLACCSDMVDLGLPSVLHGLLVDECSEADLPTDISGASGSSWGCGSWKEGGTPTTRRRRSRSLGGTSSGFAGGEGGTRVLVRVLVLLNDILPQTPLDFHPLCCEQTPPADGTSPASPSAVPAKSGPMSRRSVDACLIRVTNPRGAICTPDLETSRSSGGASSNSIKLELGTTLSSPEQVSMASGIMRYRTSLGWVSDRVFGSESEPICQRVSVEEDDEAATAAKHVFFTEREALYGPLLALLLPSLVELHRSAVSSAVLALCRSVLMKTLHYLPPELLTPYLVESSMVSRLSSVVARLASWKPGQAMTTHAGLLLGGLLLDKAPQAYGEALQREGMLAAAHFHLHHDKSLPATSDLCLPKQMVSSPLSLPVPFSSSPYGFDKSGSLMGSSPGYSRSLRPHSPTSGVTVGRERSNSECLAAAAAAIVDEAMHGALFVAARALLEKTGPAGMGDAMAWLPVPQGAPVPGVLGVLTSLAHTLDKSGREETKAALEAASSVSRTLGVCSSPEAMLRTCHTAWERKGGKEAGASCEAALTTLCSLLGSSKGISNYELLSSGLLPHLVTYLTASEVVAGHEQEGEAEKREEKTAEDAEMVDLVVDLQRRRLRRHRARLFCSTFYLRNSTVSFWPVLGPEAGSNTTGAWPSPSCMQRLVTQLHSCLSASDAFPLELSTGGLGGLSGASSSKGVLAMLTQPLKLKVKCLSAEGDPHLQAYLQARGMLHFSVLMEPLASMASLRDFLERRLQQAPPSLPPTHAAAPAGTGGQSHQTTKQQDTRNATGGQEDDEEEEDDKDVRHRRRHRTVLPLTRQASDLGGSEEGASGSDGCRDDDGDDDDEEDFEVEEADDDSSSEDTPYPGGDEDKENAGYNQHLPFGMGSQSASSSSGSETSSSGASSLDFAKPATSSTTTAATASSSSSLGSKLLQRAGRLVGVGGCGEEEEGGAGAPYNPWDKYRTTGFTLVINGVKPTSEDGPVLETTFMGFGRRGAPMELWETTHVVGWRLAEKKGASAATGAESCSDGKAAVDGVSSSSSSISKEGGKRSSVRTAAKAAVSRSRLDELLPSWWESHPIDQYLAPEGPWLAQQEEEAEDVLAAEAEYEVLRVLRLLYGLNRNALSLATDESVGAGAGGGREPSPAAADSLELASRILREEAWINRTLSERVSLQLKDPLVLITKTMPRWCELLLDVCPFLLPCGVRKEWFYSSNFGLPRALHRLSLREGSTGSTAGGGGGGVGGGSRGHGGGRGSGAGSVQHLKVRVSRHKLLQSADKVLEECAKRRLLLETEYQDEPGTGSGPTAEFFALVSQEMCKPALGLWRRSGAEGGGLGLFPRPQALKPAAELLSRFRCLGRLLGQALLDERLLDIRLAPPLVAALSGQPLCQSLPGALEELRCIDEELGRQVAQMVTMSGMGAVTAGGAKMPTGLNREAVSDLCLNFTLPGYDRVHLLPKGDQEDVTADRLGLYIQRLLQVSLVEGVQEQVKALMDGFHDIVPEGAIGCFTVEEIASMLTGAGSEFGTYDDILEAIACDHGYSRGSRAVGWLVEILADMSGEEQRRFLMFVTGCPCLPVGGLRGCSPRLTVVKKVLEGRYRSLGQMAIDAMLPSASTCTNYLKLPEYSSKAIMKEKLMYSISHGQHSFHLS